MGSSLSTLTKGEARGYVNCVSMWHAPWEAPVSSPGSQLSTSQWPRTEAARKQDRGLACLDMSEGSQVGFRKVPLKGDRGTAWSHGGCTWLMGPLRGQRRCWGASVHCAQHGCHSRG